MYRNTEECQLYLQIRKNYLKSRTASVWKELPPEILSFLLCNVFKPCLASYVKEIYILGQGFSNFIQLNHSLWGCDTESVVFEAS